MKIKRGAARSGNVEDRRPKGVRNILDHPREAERQVQEADRQIMEKRAQLERYNDYNNPKVTKTSAQERAQRRADRYR